MSQYDCIIAGGGIGGAVLANLLTQKQRRVLILERELTALHRARPEVLWPQTVATLNSLLPSELQSEWAQPVDNLTVIENEKILLEVTPDIFQRAGANPNSTDPNATRELLMRHTGCEVRRGMEVLGVIEHNNRVRGVKAKNVSTGQVEEFSATWVVADDGSHSHVRESLGIKIKLRDVPIEFFPFDFAWPAGLNHSGPRIYLNSLRRQSGLYGTFFLPWPNGRGIGLLAFRRDQQRDEASLNNAWRDFASRNALVKEFVGKRLLLKDLPRISIQWGHAERYGVPGAVLMGDAAHAVSPAGGQGANMSIADAKVLAELLLENDSTRVIPEYERQRREANARSLGITRQLTFMLSLPGVGLLSPLLPWFFERIQRDPSSAISALRYASTAFATKRN